MLGGSILDIDWSPDNSRIVVVGEGQPPAKVCDSPAARARDLAPHPGRPRLRRRGALLARRPRGGSLHVHCT